MRAFPTLLSMLKLRTIFVRGESFGLWLRLDVAAIDGQFAYFFTGGLNMALIAVVAASVVYSVWDEVKGVNA